MDDDDDDDDVCQKEKEVCNSDARSFPILFSFFSFASLAYSSLSYPTGSGGTETLRV